jgi:hypothetical protein
MTVSLGEAEPRNWLVDFLVTNIGYSAAASICRAPSRTISSNGDRPAPASSLDESAS